MQPRGAVNPLTVVLVILIAAACYWAVVFGPVYIDNAGVGEAIAIGLAASNEGAENMHEKTLRKINMGPDPVGHHMEENADGELVERPGLDIPPESVTVVVDEQRRTAKITVDYTRQVRLKPTQSVRTVRFHSEKEQKY